MAAIERSGSERKWWVAAGLALLSPVYSMLYLGRPWRALAYLAASLLIVAVGFALARGGFWPAGVALLWFTWVPAIVGIVDARRIIDAQQGGFPRRWYSGWKGLAAIFGGYVVFALTFRAVAFEPFRQPSGSMLPTLVEGDQYFVKKFAYGLRVPFTAVRLSARSPQRGDIVVFRVASGILYAKRVVGLPGDVVTLDMTSKRMTINGEPIQTDLLGDYASNVGIKLIREQLDGRSHLLITHEHNMSPGGSFTVPAGSYFVLGDNRDNSMDSRFPEIGYVAEADIVGKAAWIWWNTENPMRAGTVPL